MVVGVLGAGGTIAPAIVRDLAGSEEVDALRLLDLDPARAEAVARAHGCGKATSMAVEPNGEDRAGEIESRLGGVDVVVNSASYRINLDAMRACLAAGCHYLDLGGLYWMTQRQLELSEEFSAAGLLAILGIGSAPGKTNLLASRAAQVLAGDPSEQARADAESASIAPGPLDSAHAAAAGRDLNPPRGESFPYALRTLVDEATMSPIAIEGGEPVELDPLSEGGELDFGDPIGTTSTIYTLHSEVLTFPTSFGCTEASFRLSLAPRVEERLRELTDADEAEVERVAAAAAPPSDGTLSVHLADCTRDGRHVRVRSITEPIPDWGLGGGIVSTATPAAAAVRLLARGALAARGALPPERCIEPRMMFGELERRGVRFEVGAPSAVAARGVAG